MAPSTLVRVRLLLLNLERVDLGLRLFGLGLGFVDRLLAVLLNLRHAPRLDRGDLRLLAILLLLLLRELPLALLLRLLRLQPRFVLTREPNGVDLLARIVLLPRLLERLLLGARHRARRLRRERLGRQRLRIAGGHRRRRRTRGVDTDRRLRRRVEVLHRGGGARGG